MATQRDFVPIIWHPWRNNPIDFVGKLLQAADGTPYRIERRGIPDNFVILAANAEVLRTDDNFQVCYFLNAREIGLSTEATPHDNQR